MCLHTTGKSLYWSGINDESAPFQLFQCAQNELGDSLLKANPHAAFNTQPDLLAAMRASSCNWCPTHQATATTSGT